MDISSFPPILLYHQVTPIVIDNQLLAVSPENFDSHLGWLRSNKQVLPLPELLQKLERNEPCPDCVAITFDDGYADNLINALPLLEKHQLPATFFITSGLLDSQKGYWGDIFEDIFLAGRDLPAWADLPFLETPLPCRTRSERLSAHDKIRRKLKYVMSVQERENALSRTLSWAGLPQDPPARNRMLTKDELRLLAASQYATIGAHCVTHTRLSLMTLEEQEREIEESRQTLEQLTGRPVTCLAYPFGGSGDYDDSTRRIIAKSALYGLAGTFNAALESVFPADIPRYLVRNWDKNDFIAWLNGSLEEKHDYEAREFAKRIQRVLPGAVRVAPTQETASQA